MNRSRKFREHTSPATIECPKVDVCANFFRNIVWSCFILKTAPLYFSIYVIPIDRIPGTNPGSHDPKQPDKFRGGRDTTMILPDDATQVYQKAVPYKAGKNWYGRNVNGEFYRYQPTGGNDPEIHGMAEKFATWVGGTQRFEKIQ